MEFSLRSWLCPRPSSCPLFPLRPSLHSSSQLSASLTLDASADLAGKIAQA